MRIYLQMQTFDFSYQVQQYSKPKLKIPISESSRNVDSLRFWTLVEDLKIGYRLRKWWKTITWQRQYNLMMAQKQSFVEVTYEFQKGLLFRWNFRDLFQQTTFFNHIFVIRSNHSERLTHFLNSYYRKLKSGDLISVIFYDQNRDQVRKMKWIERTHISTFDFSSITKRISKDPVSKEVKQALTRKAIEETMSNSQHFIVNFLMQQGCDSMELLKAMVDQGRKAGGFTHICSFFGEFKHNSISFTSGINFFALEAEDLQNLLHFYSVHINSAVIKKAKITLHCINGQLLAYHDSIWKNIEFNKLQKMFYGPSVSYAHDQLHFFMTESGIGQVFQLNICLDIQLFSGQMLQSNKRIKLCVPNEKYLDKSINTCYFESQTNMHSLINDSSYSTFSVAKLIRDSNN